MYEYLKTAAAITVALGPCTSAHAIQENTPEPGKRYAVVDIAAGDTLNVRAQPGTASEIVGKLGPGTSGLAVAGTRAEVGGSVWWQVIGPKGLGWVNARYLSPVDVHGPVEQVFPLRCIGTEPFWSLTVRDGRAMLETPERKETWDAGEMTPAQGISGRYAVRLEHDTGVGHLAAWRNYGFCSDGMSDVGYPFEGIVAGPDASVRAGCCMRAGSQP